MTDREFLELAAKAAGMKEKWVNGGIWIREQFCEVPWSPLEDDGQALQLAVTLNLGIRANRQDHWQYADQTIVIWDDHEGIPRQLRQEHDGDPMAATRRAIVRAAAAIGKAMPCTPS